MSNEAATPLSKEDQDRLKWMSEHYLRSIYTLIDSNRVYLNQGITWSIGIITAVMIFGLTYMSSLQEVRSPDGRLIERSAPAILKNVTDADILLLTTVFTVAFAFVANFMSRSIKGYLNVVRYAALYSRIVRLASGKTTQTAHAVSALADDIDTYDAAFRPPLLLRQAVEKMLTELGYGLILAILCLLLAGMAYLWVTTSTTVSSVWFWMALALGPAWLAVELSFLRFGSSYFRYAEGRAKSWPDAEMLK